jgi:serine/threonine-protein phosphatase 5
VEFQECKVTEIDDDEVAPQLEGKWYPRGRPWTDEDLDAEVANVKKESPVPSDYKGVVYSGPSSLDDAWIQKFMDQQKEGILLPKAMAYELVIDTIKVLTKEKTMSEFEVKPGEKVTVCGDTHGQYWDTLNIFKLNGLPSASNPYVFNGDFVDRGSWGMENVLLLYALKVKDPSSMHFNRGNHELIEANMIYGFAGECMAKYDETMFDLFSESFRKLSLCHLVSKKVFITHGGLPGPNPRIYVPGMSHAKIQQ